MFGGSTGDDSYDHTITDKVQAYNPRTQVWTVEKSLSSPRHKVIVCERKLLYGNIIVLYYLSNVGIIIHDYKCN